jgi:Phosphate-selective porin O and P
MTRSSWSPRTSSAGGGIPLALFLITAFAPARPAAAADADSAAAPPPLTAPSVVSLPRVGGYIQLREIAQERVGLTAVLNRARVSVDGALPRRFSYRALLEMQASAGARVPATVSLREAIVRWSPTPFAVTAGEFKTPFTREYLIPVPALELADLAIVVDSLAPKYDVGVMGECALGAFAALYAGVFNGEGANSTANRDSIVLIVGRIITRPLPQLALGASGTRDGADSLRWGIDASVQQWGGIVRAEYVTRHRRGRDPDKNDFGWYLFESLRLVPRVQLLARQEDFQRPELGISRRVRGLAYGVNFDIAPTKVKLLLEFSRRVSGRFQTRSDTFIAQVQGQL